MKEKNILVIQQANQKQIYFLLEQQVFFYIIYLKCLNITLYIKTKAVEDKL